MMSHPQPLIKVCCIQSCGEARVALSFGVDALGLVSAMPSGPGIIPESQIAAIVAELPPTIASFLLTSETRADAIVEQQRRCRTTTLQLVDDVDIGELEALRARLPRVKLVQVLHVQSAQALERAKIVETHVDALLLDSGNPDASIRELGGTGRTHDWSVSQQIVQRVSVPVFLAGGLRPDNVAASIDQVHPAGVDVCSGVRSNDKLDASKLRAFVEAARGV